MIRTFEWVSDHEKLRPRSRGWKRRSCARLLAVLVAMACHAPRPEEVAPRVITHVAQSSGTDARLIAVSAVDAKVVWVSGAKGTWRRTIDGGTTWTGGVVPGADSLQFRDVHAVNDREAFLLSIGNGPQSRIYHTADAGRSWTLQFQASDPKEFFDCFDFWDQEHGIAIGDAVDSTIVMLETKDGGAHWARIPSSLLPPALPGEGSFAASGTCLVTRRGGWAWAVMSNKDHARLLRTADYGKSWQVDTIPVMTREGVGPQSVSFLDDHHGIVLAGGYNAQLADVEAAATLDGGRTWTTTGRPPLPTGVWGGVYIPGARAATVVAVGPSGSAFTRDDGRTWVAIDTLNYWSVGFAGPNAGWAVGEGGRITRLGGF